LSCFYGGLLEVRLRIERDTPIAGTQHTVVVKNPDGWLPESIDLVALTAVPSLVLDDVGIS